MYTLCRISAFFQNLHFSFQSGPARSEANDRSQQSWKDLSYAELAFKIVSLYISPSEIPPEDLKGIIERSYSTFRAEDVVPLTHLQDDNLYLLELFHGPSYSFKDCVFPDVILIFLC